MTSSLSRFLIALIFPVMSLLLPLTAIAEWTSSVANAQAGELKH